MKSAERQSLITVECVPPFPPLPGYWQTRTGGDPTAAHSKEWDGGALNPDVLAGNVDYSDVVVSRLFDDAVDGPLLPWLMMMVGRFQGTISDAQTDGNLVPTGDVIQWFGTLVGVTPPAANSASSSAKKISLTFAVTRVA